MTNQDQLHCLLVISYLHIREVLGQGNCSKNYSMQRVLEHPTVAGREREGVMVKPATQNTISRVDVTTMQTKHHVVEPTCSKES